MSMMDFLDRERAIEALEDSHAARDELNKQLENVYKYIFLLEYFLETGELLDPEIFGLEPLEEDDE